MDLLFLRKKRGINGAHRVEGASKSRVKRRRESAPKKGVWRRGDVLKNGIIEDSKG